MRRLTLIGAVLVVACGDQPAAVVPPPSVDIVSVAANPQNVLSGIVTARLRDAEQVVVRHRLAGTLAYDETPALPVTDPTVRLPVLGLLPDAQYQVKVVASGPGGTIESQEMLLSTGSLPPDLPRYTAGGSDPSPGFVAFASGRYAVVIDNTGRVVWYRHFPNGAGLNMMAQPTGHYVLRPPALRAGDPDLWVELDVFGDVTRTMGCAGGLPNRIHDLLVEPAGSYWIMCDEMRTMDLRSVGGVANANVIGTVIQRVSREGTLLFSWTPFDHFEITDLDAVHRAGPTVNWTHGNAFDIDGDGNLLVSWRSLNEITKIDSRTGAVRWRLGGRRNQFSFTGTNAPPFAGQHSVRALGNGNIVLLDNVGDPLESRAERYLVDDAVKVAQLTQAHAPVPRVVTQLGGSVQRSQSGRTLVSFGTTGRVEEVDDQGRVVWRIEGNPGYVFRAQRIASLYAPGVGTGR